MGGKINQVPQRNCGTQKNVPLITAGISAGTKIAPKAVKYVNSVVDKAKEKGEKVYTKTNNALGDFFWKLDQKTDGLIITPLSDLMDKVSGRK